MLRLRRLGIGVVSLCLVFVAGSSLQTAHANPDSDPAQKPGPSGPCGNKNSSLYCEETGGGSNSGRDNGIPVYTDPKPYKAVKYVPACSGNDATPNSADALCSAFESCPVEGENRWMVYTQVLDPPTSPPDPYGWKGGMGSVCRSAEEVARDEAGPPQITEWMIREAAQAVAPKSRVNAEPAATSYVNVPNNFYTDSGPQTETVTLIGFKIPLEYSPQSYSWSFGDGGKASGAGIPNARVGQSGAVEWDYRRNGNYNVTVSRTFTVTATLPNGQRLTLESPVSSTSPPYAIDIDEIQSVVTRVR